MRRWLRPAPISSVVLLQRLLQTASLRPLLGLALASLGVGLCLILAHDHLPDAAWWSGHRSALLALQAHHPWALGLGLFAAITLLSALALPGNAALALAAGLCFGGLLGTVLVVLGSTVGATLAFLAARHWWRDPVRRRWGRQLAQVQAAVSRDGSYYLFSLRVVPVIPYPVVNPLMGLTTMPVAQFFSVSLLGMLAGSAAYAYAGSALAQARALPDLASPALLGGLLGLALLPWLMRALWQRWRRAGLA